MSFIIPRDIFCWYNLISVQLLLTFFSAEHVTGSLKNIYMYLEENDGQFYKSQVHN